MTLNQYTYTHTHTLVTACDDDDDCVFCVLRLIITESY